MSQSLRLCLQLLALQYVPELERLKLSLDIKGNATEHFFDRPAHARHTVDTTQLATSNLPQLDWDQLSNPSAPQMPAAVPSAPQAGQQNDPFAYAAPPARPPSGDPFAASPGLSNAYTGSNPAFQSNGNAMDLLSGAAASSIAPSLLQQTAPSQYARSNSLKLPAASQEALSKHAIMSQPQARQRPANRLLQQSIYPQFDKEPLAPIGKFCAITVNAISRHGQCITSHCVLPPSSTAMLIKTVVHACTNQGQILFALNACC